MVAIVNILKGIAVALFGGTLQETVNGVTQSVTSEGIIPVFFNWLTQPTVLPFFMIGTCCALVLLATRIVKAIFWGQ